MEQRSTVVQLIEKSWAIRMRLGDADVLAGEQRAKIADMEDILVRTQTELELEKFKALHEQQQQYEKLLAKEKARTDSWINGLKESSSREQHRLENTIQMLSTELCEVKGYRSCGISESSNEFGSEYISRSGKDGSKSGSRCAQHRIHVPTCFLTTIQPTTQA